MPGGIGAVWCNCCAALIAYGSQPWHPVLTEGQCQAPPARPASCGLLCSAQNAGSGGKPQAGVGLGVHGTGQS